MSYNRSIFFEIQKQYGAIVWIVLAGIAAVSFSIMLVFYDQWEGIQKEFSKNQLLLIGGLISALFIGLYYLFLNMRMETKVDCEGISFRYPPFMNKFQLIRFDEIENLEVCEYNPIKDYGGWGYRKPAHYTHKQLKALKYKRPQHFAYTIKGKTGLRIKFKSQKIILLGTQRKEALEYELKKHYLN